MEHSKVFKKETYIDDNGAKMYAEHRLEYNDVQVTIVWGDCMWQMISFPTIWEFEQFVEKNDFELISK